MGDERDEIRRRTDIIELVSQRVSLRPSGRGFVGLCPFHDDRHPSFHVNPATGRYKCFSCGEGGDVFTWVMKTQGLDFIEALKDLAARAGVELAGRSGPAPDTDARKRRLALMETALAFFREQLGRSPQALAYCDGRGLDAAVREAWALGYAPDAGGALTALLKRGGASLQEAKELFLVDEDASGGFYDRFRGRLMFPIRDERGDLVAFGGRLLREGQPKYINSSDTPLYSKSRVLYGSEKARLRWPKSGRATLCEGYLDVIACHQAGVDGAVASLGTSLTEDQAKLFARFKARVTILYDADAAGQKAAARALDVLEATGVPTRVALMPEGDDPDTVLAREGPEALARLVDAAISAYEFRLRAFEVTLPPSDPDFWPQAVTLLAKAPTEIELEAQILRLATLHPTLHDLPTAAAALRRDVSRLRMPDPPSRPARPSRALEITARTPLAGVEVSLFAGIVDPTSRSAVWPFLDYHATFPTDTGRELGSDLVTTFDAPPQGELFDWIPLIPERSADLLSALVLTTRALPKVDEEEIRSLIESLKESHRRANVQKNKARARDDDATLRAIIEAKRRSVRPDPPAS